MDNKINELYKMVRSRCNKWVAVVIVVFTLIFSFAIIGIGLQRNYNVTSISVAPDCLNNEKCQFSDTCKMASCCSITTLPLDSIGSKSMAKTLTLSNGVCINVPVSNTSTVLFYCCILVFIALSLWGAFTMLFKVLKYENDMKSKILDMQKDICKEELMWELTKKKKEFEHDNKYKELEFRIKEFDEFEKKHKQFEHDLKLNEK